MYHERLYSNYYYFSFVLWIFVFILSINRITCSYDTSYNLLDSRSKINNKKDFYSDFVLCRRCGAELADAKNIINHLSPEATVITNQTLFERKGVEVQSLLNTFNIQFQVITISKSKCSPIDEWLTTYSWYPGYAWKPCVCPQCRVHHGWLFELIGASALNTNQLSDKAFFMLKLPNLLSQKFADSLIVIPKSHKN